MFVFFKLTTFGMNKAHLKGYSVKIKQKTKCQKFFNDFCFIYQINSQISVSTLAGSCILQYSEILSASFIFSPLPIIRSSTFLGIKLSPLINPWPRSISKQIFTKTKQYQEIFDGETL